MLLENQSTPAKMHYKRTYLRSRDTHDPYFQQAHQVAIRNGWDGQSGLDPVELCLCIQICLRSFWEHQSHGFAELLKHSVWVPGCEESVANARPEPTVLVRPGPCPAGKHRSPIYVGKNTSSTVTMMPVVPVS